MKATAIAIAVAGAFAAGAVLAQSGPDVVKSKCMGCHDVDKKKVGPSFKDIAAKKKGQEAAIVAKMKEGKGHPKVAGTDAELKAAVDHVMKTN
ncbi:MAG TPA: c-type cytochrome [Burkholderiales bacterium]|jgi:cytochrome c|nr:c-type cytochrome [Burkholderiales bacterium]